ncbi:MAG: hypothetical protein M1438_03155 [Deltaproteobacteria bacterium]|nr:hypothetical protein [Deltaproteobacteria bacterium]
MAEDVELRGRIVKVGGFTGDPLFEEEGGQQVYLPKDEIAVVQQADGTVKVTMPEWLAKKKGLY